MSEARKLGGGPRYAGGGPATAKQNDDSIPTIAPLTAEPVPALEPSANAAEEWDIHKLLEELCAESCKLVRRGLSCTMPLPSPEVVAEITAMLRSVIFPGYFGSSAVKPAAIRYYLGSTLDKLEHLLEQQILRGLAFDCEDEACVDKARSQAREMTVAFLKRLPEIQRMLGTDVQAAYEGDPAASSPGEAIFCYPGILAITNHRVAHELWNLGAPILPRMISEHAHSETGIDIHPGASIGPGFFMDHGTGVVIGETCIIGERVCLYQGVTLGAKSFPLDKHGNPIKGIPRHPIIEDNVTIYSGATILGRITIGSGSMIGGNVWLTRSVPPKSRITLQSPRRERFEHGGGI
jgi:serine O-acetyltransferase